MENTIIPSVGRIVHYHSHGSPTLADGTQKYPSVVRAAIITQVHNNQTLDLCILNPTGMFFNQKVCFGPNGGEWEWPVKI